MRRVIQTADAALTGVSKQTLHDIAAAGLANRIGYGLFVDGRRPPTNLETSYACAVATDGALSGSAAGEFYDLDDVKASRVDFTVPGGHSNQRNGARRRTVEVLLVKGVPVVNGTQTLMDLAAELDDLRWEQVLESALRKQLTTITEVEAALARMSAARTPGTARVRRVLALRPNGAPATGSLLETLAVQLCRKYGLPTPTRQFRIELGYGRHYKVDLSWPEIGVFLELDGQDHKNQPVYDANRQNKIVALTGWLTTRLTWHQIVYVARATARELEAILAQGRAITEARQVAREDR